MTNLKSKMSQKGSGNTSSRRSKNDNQKGFKKIAKELGLDIDKNLKILDTLLDEFTLDSLTPPQVQIIKANILTGGKAVANYLGDRDNEEKSRVVFYLKTLKQFLTYQHGLKTTEEINKRILFLNQMLNPSEESFLLQREMLMPEITLSEDLRALHDECLLIVGIRGVIYKTADDGSGETDTDYIDLDFWSKNTIKDILNLEKDYREYQLQMLSDTAEYITFAQYLENKLEEGKTLDEEAKKELREIVSELQEDEIHGNPERGSSKTSATGSSNSEETGSSNQEETGSSNPEDTGSGSSKTNTTTSEGKVATHKNKNYKREILDNLKSKGWNLTPVNDRGDCLFQSLGIFLQKKGIQLGETPDTNTFMVRRMIVNYIRDNWPEFSMQISTRDGCVKDGSVEQSSLKDWCMYPSKYQELMLTPREQLETELRQARFGGHEELIAFTRLDIQGKKFQVQLLDLRSDDSIVPSNAPGVAYDESNKTNPDVVTLLYDAPHMHYSLLTPTDTPQTHDDSFGVQEQKIGPAQVPKPAPEQHDTSKGVAAYVSKIFRKGNNPELVAAILARE